MSEEDAIGAAVQEAIQDGVIAGFSEIHSSLEATLASPYTALCAHYLALARSVSAEAYFDALDKVTLAVSGALACPGARHG